jgi:uncharacterized protein YegL
MRQYVERVINLWHVQGGQMSLLDFLADTLSQSVTCVSQPQSCFSTTTRGNTMARNELAIQNDLIENPSPRCACTVVLDTSASMSGAPIQQLNAGLQHFLQAVHADEVAACSVDISVITAGGQICEELPFTNALNVEGCGHFSAGGATPLGAAVDLALDNLAKRKKQYKQNGVPYYQPWLVMISDGVPTDQWRAAAARAKQLSAEGKLVSLAVGVEGASLAALGEFSHRPAVMLDGLKFSEFFQWLSASMSRVSQSASTTSSVDLPPMNGWASI